MSVIYGAWRCLWTSMWKQTCGVWWQTNYLAPWILYYLAINVLGCGCWQVPGASVKSLLDFWTEPKIGSGGGGAASQKFCNFQKPMIRQSWQLQAVIGQVYRDKSFSRVSIFLSSSPALLFHSTTSVNFFVLKVKHLGWLWGETARQCVCPYSSFNNCSISPHFLTAGFWLNL